MDENDDASASRALLVQLMPPGTGDKSATSDGRDNNKNTTEVLAVDTVHRAANSEDDTLYFACERHQLDLDLINSILAERPGALAVPRDRGWLPIHHAAMANSFDAVELLLDRYPEGAHMSQDDGFLPLHMAVYFEDVDVDVVAMILSANPAAAQHRSNDGRTALHIALENSNMDYRLVRLLLDANPAAAMATTDLGQLPLHICLENKHCCVEVFMAILDTFPDAIYVKDAAPRHRLPIHYAIHAAAVENKYNNRGAFGEIVKILIDRLPITREFQMGDYHGKNPLHLALHMLAVAAGEMSASKANTDGGEEGDSRADTPIGLTDHSYSVDTSLESPREMSAYKLLESIVNMLLVSYPALLKDKCSNGRLPIVEYLEHAVRPSVEVVAAVAKANPKALAVGDHLGLTPLHILLNKPVYCMDIVEIFLQYCPEASTLPCMGSASLPIHVALRNNYPSVQPISYHAAKRLLEVYPGAADQPDSKGFLPVHLLVSRDSPDTNLLRRLLKICPLGVESATCEEAGYLLPIHCAVVAPRPSKTVIDLLLDAYPEGLHFRCASNLSPLDYLFLNMKKQYSKKNMLRSATPCLRVQCRKGTPPHRACLLPVSSSSGEAEVSTESNSPEKLIDEMWSEASEAMARSPVDSLTTEVRKTSIDNGETIAGRNNNVMSYFKGKTDEEILAFTLELLKGNDYEVTDDIIVMFGSRLNASSDIADDMLMFRGNFGADDIDSCQCNIQ